MFYKRANKIITLIILFTLFFTAISVLFDMQIVEADSTRTIYTESNLDTAKYPGYKDLIDNLKKAHPNWVFKIMYTELDWNQEKEHLNNHNDKRQRKLLFLILLATSFSTFAFIFGSF